MAVETELAYAGQSATPSTALSDARALQRELSRELRGLQQLTHLLALRFAVFNIVAFALLGAAHAQGWVVAVFQSDATGISAAIALTFLAGLGMSVVKVWRISGELNSVQDTKRRADSLAAEYLTATANQDSGSRGILANVLRERVAARVSAIKHVANSLVLMGLVGTVVGFIIALSGVDPDTVGDVAKVGPMVGELIRGMSIALHTTLIGAVLSLWLTVNYHMLAGGAVKLVTRLVRLGEANARD